MDLRKGISRYHYQERDNMPPQSGATSPCTQGRNGVREGEHSSCSCSSGKTPEYISRNGNDPFSRSLSLLCIEASQCTECPHPVSSPHRNVETRCGGWRSHCSRRTNAAFRILGPGIPEQNTRRGSSRRGGTPVLPVRGYTNREQKGDHSGSEAPGSSDSWMSEQAGGRGTPPLQATPFARSP